MEEQHSHRRGPARAMGRGAVALGMALCLALQAGCTTGGWREPTASSLPEPRESSAPSSGPEESTPRLPGPADPPATEESPLVEGYRRGRDPVPFSQMTYKRPDIQEMRRQVKEQVSVIRRGESLEQVFEAVLAAGRVLDHYDTMYTLSDIYSDADLSDDGWYEEWLYCNDGYRVYSSLWSDVYTAIQRSAYADQLLPLWDTNPDYPDPVNRDPRRSASLSGEMDAIADEALDILNYATVPFGREVLTLDEAYDHPDWVAATAAWCKRYGPQLLELYTQLAAAGSELARECYGYGDYAEYLFDMHQRDYTPAMALALTDELVERFSGLDDDLLEWGYWSGLYDDYRDFDALMETARVVLEEMGGEMTDALDLLLDYGLYHNQLGDAQYGRPYVIHLATPNVPFLYCPFDDTVMSAVNFTHEFGHFYEMYITMEAYCVPDDLSEVHSQAMSLLFAQTHADRTGDRVLLAGALTDTVDTLLSQSFNAAIELRVFALAPEELTVQAVEGIGREQSARFGYWQGHPQMARYMWLTDAELFTDPLQPLCYAVSAGAALELWTLSLEDMGAALDKYDRLVRHEQSFQFVYNLEAADMMGPFVPGWAADTEALVRGQVVGRAWEDAA